MSYENKLEIVLEALRSHIRKVQDAWRNEIKNRCVNAEAYGRDNESKTTVVDEICKRTIGAIALDFPGTYCKNMDDSIRREIELAIHS